MGLNLEVGKGQNPSSFSLAEVSHSPRLAKCNRFISYGFFGLLPDSSIPRAAGSAT